MACINKAFVKIKWGNIQVPKRVPGTVSAQLRLVAAVFVIRPINNRYAFCPPRAYVLPMTQWQADTVLSCLWGEQFIGHTDKARGQRIKSYRMRGPAGSPIDCLWWSCKCPVFGRANNLSLSFVMVHFPEEETVDKKTKIRATSK